MSRLLHVLAAVAAFWFGWGAYLMVREALWTLWVILSAWFRS